MFYTVKMLWVNWSFEGIILETIPRTMPRHAEMLGIAIMGIRNLFEGGEPTWCKFYTIKVQVGPWISLKVESWTEQTIHEFWSRDLLQTINHSRVDFHYSNGRLEDSRDIYLTWILWDWMIISPTFFRDRKPFQSFTNDFWRFFFPASAWSLGRWPSLKQLAPATLGLVSRFQMSFLPFWGPEANPTKCELLGFLGWSIFRPHFFESLKRKLPATFASSLILSTSLSPNPYGLING